MVGSTVAIEVSRDTVCRCTCGWILNEEWNFVVKCPWLSPNLPGTTTKRLLVTYRYWTLWSSSLALPLEGEAKCRGQCVCVCLSFYMSACLSVCPLAYFKSQATNIHDMYWRFGDRAFAVAAPRVWNSLPTDIKLHRSTTTSFKRRKLFHLTGASLNICKWLCNALPVFL